MTATTIYSQTAMEYYNLANQASTETMFNEAIEYYNLAGDLWLAAGNMINYAVMMENIGAQYYNLGNNDEALEYLNNSLVLFMKLKEKSNTALSLNKIGVIYSDLGQYEKALEYHYKAFAIREYLGENYNKATSLYDIGIVYSTWGQYDKAIEYYNKALAIFEKLGEKSNIAFSLYNIGNVYSSWGKYDKAIEYYNKALAIFEELGDKSNIALAFGSIGYQYSSWGEIDKAIEYYNNALAIFEELGDKSNIASCLNSIGNAYRFWGQYDKAIEYYNKSLVISEELGDKSNIALTLNNIGMVYASWGQYNQALEYFNNALTIRKYLREKSGIAVCLNNIGNEYYFWGQYDKAIEYYNKALAIFEELRDKSNIALTLNNIGMVYASWGQYNQALEYHNNALAFFEELGEKSNIATSLNNIGLMYYALGQYDKAMEYYINSLTLHEELGEKSGMASAYDNISLMYYVLEQYDKATEYCNKALAIRKELGEKSGMASSYDNIGTIYYLEEQYDKALEYLYKELTIRKELGEIAQIAGCFNNIGYIYLSTERYSEAEYNFNQSIAIIEEIRQTAEGSIRMDYLASQISSYYGLISTFIRNNKPAMAFNTIELSSAKYLIEQLGEKIKGIDKSIEGIEIYQKKLDNNTAVINYSNINRDDPVRIFIDTNNIYSIELNNEEWVTHINNKYKNEISRALDSLKGVKIRGKEIGLEEITIEKKADDDFKKIINYYRLLLSKQNPTEEEEEAVVFIGKEFYNFLLGNTDEQLDGKDELIIIPDGILFFLPFETLIMPDGRYLIEKYHIKYTQSLTVSEIISKRNYSQDRKPFLAFGGAVYDELSYETDIIQAEKQLEYLKKETFLALSRGQSTRNAYSRLGFNAWDNLPGTLTEVQALNQVIEGSKIYTGKSVNESTVKSLSEQGKLKDYKVLHFATHGLVVPEIPELSALVLSLSKEEENNEDGYLTMKEIARLDINADFVNLSACETGLGKIYGGEGVVGLTQSFLIAGANSLSVSLWQVSDQSTMKFMLGVYHLIQEQGLSYDRAITEMKRAFISGAVSTTNYDIQRGFKWIETDDENIKPNRYSSPYYWAPFVYYGN